MNQKERQTYLFEYLKKESQQYQTLQVPKEAERSYLRALMNIRMPKPIGGDFLAVQDAFLQQEAIEKDIVDVMELPVVKRNGRIALWQGDITRLRADAIVNAANSQMLGCFVPCHGCIDNAIHSAAGIQLREVCNAYMAAQRRKYGAGYEEPTGQAVLTPAFNLPCRYVVHTVGPIIHGSLRKEDCRLLESCYRSCLEKAAEKQLESIVFCCISTGEFHFPKEKAAEIAVAAVEDFLWKNKTLRRVVFNVFKEEDKKIYERLLQP